MAFINEYISEDNKKKYGIEEINKRYLKAGIYSHWTFDREQDVYLMGVTSGREEFANIHGFIFYWQQTKVFIEFKRTGDGERGGKGWTNWEIMHMEMPPEIRARQEEMFPVLKEALTAYKDFGIYSTIVDHTATFNF